MWIILVFLVSSWSWAGSAPMTPGRHAEISRSLTQLGMVREAQEVRQRALEEAKVRHPGAPSAFWDLMRKQLPVEEFLEKLVPVYEAAQPGVPNAAFKAGVAEAREIWGKELGLRIENRLGTKVAAKGEFSLKEAAADARTAFLAIIAGLVPVFKESGVTGFFVRGCTHWQTTELIGFFLMEQPLVRDFVFKEQCDVEGHLETQYEPFPLDFKLRNLKDFDRVTMTWRLEKKINLAKQEGSLKVVSTRGVLFRGGGPSVKFNGDYTVLYRGATNDFQNEGGKFEVTEFGGKVVNFSQPIVVDKR